MRIWVYATRRCRRGRPDLDGQGCTWEELAEGYFPVFVFIEDGYDTLDKGVLVEFRHVEYLVGVQVTRVILVDLFEPCVQFLDLFLAELAWKLGVSHLNNYYGPEYRKIKMQLLGFWAWCIYMSIDSVFLYLYLMHCNRKGGDLD